MQNILQSILPVKISVSVSLLLHTSLYYYAIACVKFVIFLFQLITTSMLFLFACFSMHISAIIPMQFFLSFLSSKYHSLYHEIRHSFHFSQTFLHISLLFQDSFSISLLFSSHPGITLSATVGGFFLEAICRVFATATRNTGWYTSRLCQDHIATPI